ncbi:MAG TPA: hypothetical protein VMZ91_06530 [Candidatus Paceibacterota bacterium]|nr:hypothetical protein [Candidatus Paceibacterota bacterium]
MEMNEKSIDKEIENILSEAPLAPELPLVPEPKNNNIKTIKGQITKNKKIMMKGYIEFNDKGNIRKLVLIPK